jgi:hypothetical protein
MKTQLNSICTLAIFFFLTLSGFVQGKPKPHPSKDGYWVVETVPGPERKTTAYFYNQANTLIYREDLKSARINVRRPKIHAHFNTVLNQAIRQYTATQQQIADQNWVAARIR